MKDTDDIPLVVSAADLPPGEHLLWQGRPRWQALAREAFHLPWIGVYFLLLALWRITADLHDGLTRSAALNDAGKLVVPAVACIGIMAFLAWLTARATTFTLTDRRLLLRFGVALPSMVNIPLDTIEAVKLRVRPGGSGDLALTLPDAGRLFYHQLWPYARAGRPYPATPMLRAVPGVAAVGEQLAEALRVRSGQPAPAPTRATHPVPAAAPGERPVIATA